MEGKGREGGEDWGVELVAQVQWLLADYDL
jgi:hypothetical protein